MCCPEPDQSSFLALKAPAGNAKSEEGAIVDVAAMKGGNTKVMFPKDANYSFSLLKKISNEMS